MKYIITYAILICIIVIQIFIIYNQSKYHQRDLHEQGEVYTIELNRLPKICKDNKRPVQATEYKSERESEQLNYEIR